MGHLHRQALVQRAKARDALIAAGHEPEAAKATVAKRDLASVNDPLQTKAAPASKKRAVRSKGKKRAQKKKA